MSQALREAYGGGSLEELEDGQDTVVDVAEAASFALLRVVQPACPVDHNVVLPLVQPHRPT